MTSKSIFQLAIQLCGLYFIFQAILQLIKTVTLIFAPAVHQTYTMPQEYIFSQISVFAIYSISGFALVLSARFIANFFSHKDDIEPLQLKKQDVIEVFLIGVGVAKIVSSIPNVYPFIASLGSDIDTNLLANTAIIIGFNGLLIWKARSIAVYIMKLNAVSKKENS
jgi:hypothetical protein